MGEDVKGDWCVDDIVWRVHLSLYGDIKIGWARITRITPKLLWLEFSGFNNREAFQYSRTMRRNDPYLCATKTEALARAVELAKESRRKLEVKLSDLDARIEELSAGVL